MELPSTIVRVDETPGLRIVRFRGSLGIPQVTDIQEWITRFRAEKDFRFKPLLLDFKDVRYADSSAVARLVKTMHDYRRAGHEVGLFNLGPELQGVLEITRVDKLVRQFSDEAEALAGLRSGNT